MGDLIKSSRGYKEEIECPLFVQIDYYSVCYHFKEIYLQINQELRLSVLIQE